MDENKPKRDKRKRIMKGIFAEIVDPESYGDNICSINAKFITNYELTFKTNLFKDRHYNIRKDFGEDDGTPRDGIDEESVCNLIEKTLIHVLHYSMRYGAIVNYPPFNPKTSFRIVLQDKTSDEKDFLNVAAEYHFESLNSFEVTIWTAMAIENFRYRDPQYIVEIHNDKTILKQKERGKINYKMELELP
jgi:hypothetical protein